MLYTINPTLEIERVGEEFFLTFSHDRGFKSLKANAWDLLALRIILDEYDHLHLSKTQGIELKFLQKVLAHGYQEGYLIRRESQITRNEAPFQGAFFPDESYKTSETFTIQWHLTNRCDLNCRHCYDRGRIEELTLEQNYEILDDLYNFCWEKGVFGHISFSGGNPLLYPYFYDLYKKASEMGFGISILGNPIAERDLNRLCELEIPTYYQVSLEGLEETNDRIRGPGHFRKTLAFLKLMRAYEVPNGVMMTLHEENVKDLIPLAIFLQDYTDTFTFNRLSLVGAGKGLTPSSREAFFEVLEKYLELKNSHSYLELKDNFFNYILYKRGMPLVGGCTGFGCGAAFNFLVILPNGEVHACRKFPSPLGNVHKSSFKEIYHSRIAERYRLGSTACQRCRLFGVCRGCLAVTFSYNLNPFEQLDPFCPGPIET